MATRNFTAIYEEEAYIKHSHMYFITDMSYVSRNYIWYVMLLLFYSIQRFANKKRRGALLERPMVYRI